MWSAGSRLRFDSVDLQGDKTPLVVSSRRKDWIPMPRIGFVPHVTLLKRPAAQRCCVRMASTEVKSVTSYHALCDKLREISHLGGAMGLLGWDEQVMLPPGAMEARGKQKASLAACLHDLRTSKEFGELINGAEKEASTLPSMDAANVRDARRDYDLVAKMSRELAAREAELGVEGFVAWKKAREDSDFSHFAPVLEKIVDLRKEVAQVTRPEMDPYDACIDMFERGMTADRLSAVFTELKDGLVPLLGKIREALPSQPPLPEPLQGSERWDPDVQAKLSEEVAKAIGFDFEREGIMGTIHEVGHAMYEQGRSRKYAGLPVSDALSMGAHESQSLFWERCVGQSAAFWKYTSGIVHERFPHTASVGAEDFYRGVNRVMPDCLIRVETDEVTYPLHVILRFELERGLLDGSIAVDDLPQLWNEKFYSYLGATPDSDANGVLQDVHWSGLAIGYFPTYTLGAIAAAQIYRAMRRDLPDMDALIAKGSFDPIKSWLNEKIHSVGSLYPSLDALLEAATGEPLNVGYFLDYLKDKYTQLYNL